MKNPEAESQTIMSATVGCPCFCHAKAMCNCTCECDEGARLLVDTVQYVQHHFNPCKTYSPGCGSCVAYELITKLEWLIELEKM